MRCEVRRGQRRKMENIGEKKVKFKRAGSNAVNSINFQVTDVSKPLASVSGIFSAGADRTF